MPSVLFAQTEIVEMDVVTPVVNYRRPLTPIKRIDLTAELGHIFVKSPMILDAKRVDEAIVVDGRNHSVETNRFLAVRCSHATRDGDHKSEIDGQPARRAVAPMIIAIDFFGRHGFSRFLGLVGRMTVNWYIYGVVTHLIVTCYT